MTPLRVLICEDSGTYATALRRTLEHEGDINVVAVCSTAEEAISALPRAAPDLVTMDVALPGMGGIDAVGKIMGSNPIPLIVPCHRVVAGNGLGGYSGGTGIEIKRWLLIFEEALPPTLDWSPAGEAGRVQLPSR